MERALCACCARECDPVVIVDGRPACEQCICPVSDCLLPRGHVEPHSEDAPWPPADVHARRLDLAYEAVCAALGSAVACGYRTGCLNVALRAVREARECVAYGAGTKP